jgi:hypothetical protein
MDCSLRLCPAGKAWYDFASSISLAHTDYTECSNMVRDLTIHPHRMEPLLVSMSIWSPRAFAIDQLVSANADLVSLVQLAIIVSRVLQR